MKNQQLRELLTRVPSSPETDELQDHCELLDGEFDKMKKEHQRANQRANSWKQQHGECVKHWLKRQKEWKVQLWFNRLYWAGCGSAVGVVLGWLFVCYVLY